MLFRSPMESPRTWQEAVLDALASSKLPSLQLGRVCRTLLRETAGFEGCEEFHDVLRRTEAACLEVAFVRVPFGGVAR